MRILLVEPDAILANLYTTGLQGDGHIVDTAKTAQVAVQEADAHRPDLVVLNIDMARHNGMEFLYEFRSYDEWQSIPVILLVSKLNHDLAEAPVLRKDLAVSAVLVRSEMTLQQLCDAVARLQKVRS